MPNRTRNKTPVGTVITEDFGELVYQRITARSLRHARRIAATLSWASHSGGPGRPFGELSYNYRGKRLTLRTGWNV